MICQYITGVRDGDATHMIYCDSTATRGFAVNGLSPLHICKAHLVVLREQLRAFKSDTVITVL